MSTSQGINADSACCTGELAAWRDAVRELALARHVHKVARTFARVRYLALVLALAAHGLALLSLRDAMRVPPSPLQTRIEVFLLNDSAAHPSLPVSPPLRGPVVRASGRKETPSTAGVATPSEAPHVAALLHLFNRDGSIYLPPHKHFVTPLDAGIARGRELLARGHNLIHCARGRFDPSPTPEEAGNQAGKNARIAQLVMNNPLDPLATVGNMQDVGTAIELAAAGRALEEQACDDTLWNSRWESSSERGARLQQWSASTESLQQAQQFRH